MGCFYSKEDRNSRASLVAPDFDAAAKLSSTQMSSISAIKINAEGPPKAQHLGLKDQLPVYRKYERPFSVGALLNVLGKAHNMTVSDIPGAFHAMRSRHFHVWIDDNARLRKNTKLAIQLQALILLLVGKALDCNLTIYFTSQSNLSSSKLSQDTKNKATALNDLWAAQSWHEAVELVQNTDILKVLKLQSWINSQTSFEPALLAESRYFGNPLQQRQKQQYSDNGRGSQMMIENETEDEKLVKLLDHVRNLKVPYWQGWHQNELTPDDFCERYKSATRAAKLQPKSLNSIRFTHDRETNRFQRHLEEDTANPTSILILTGSPLQPTEVDAIKRLHNKAVTKVKVVGQGTQFCIGTVLFGKYLSKAEIELHKALDDFASGDRDIRDLETVDEDKFIEYGPSPEVLFKILNSYDKNIDKLPLKDVEKYGKRRLAPPNGGVLTLPWVQEVKKVFGQDDDEEDEPEEDVDINCSVAIASSSAVPANCIGDVRYPC